MRWSEGVKWKFTRSRFYVQNSFGNEQDCIVYEYDRFPQSFVNNYGPPPAYRGQLPISFEKKNDLIKFVENGGIPVVYAEFYGSIVYSDPIVSGPAKSANENKKKIAEKKSNLEMRISNLLKLADAAKTYCTRENNDDH